METEMDTNTFRHDQYRKEFPIDWRSASGRTLFAIGLWTRAAFIGACAVLAGLLMLIHGESRPMVALALALGGGALAVFGWRHTKDLLDRLDAIDTGSEANAPRQSAVAKPAPAMPRQQTRLAVE